MQTDSATELRILGRRARMVNDCEHWMVRVIRQLTPLEGKNDPDGNEPNQDPDQIGNHRASIRMPERQARVDPPARA